MNQFEGNKQIKAVKIKNIQLLPRVLLEIEWNHVYCTINDHQINGLFKTKWNPCLQTSSTKDIKTIVH